MIKLAKRLERGPHASRPLVLLARARAFAHGAKLFTNGEAMTPLLERAAELALAARRADTSASLLVLHCAYFSYHVASLLYQSWTKDPAYYFLAPYSAKKALTDVLEAVGVLKGRSFVPADPLLEVGALRGPLLKGRAGGP